MMIRLAVGTFKQIARVLVYGLIGAFAVLLVIAVDLSGLRSADAEGVQALRSLFAKGAKLVGGSIYIRQLLDGAKIDETVS